MGDLARQFGAHGPGANDGDAAGGLDLSVDTRIGGTQPRNAIFGGFEHRGIARAGGEQDVIGVNPAAVLQGDALAVHGNGPRPDNFAALQKPVIGQQNLVQQGGLNQGPDGGHGLGEMAVRLDQHHIHHLIQPLGDL